MNTEELPKTLVEFEERFSTEAACVAFVRKLKWPDGFVCSKCGNRTSWPLAPQVEECRRCAHQESVTAGTLFHQTRKPLRLWFRAITLWVASKRGLSAKELERQLGIHYETAWHWCHRLRACVGEVFGKAPLTGVVEVDEAYVGGTDDRAHGGRSLAGSKALVAGAVEVRGAAMGRVRLEKAEDATGEELQDFVVRNVKQRAVATTDGLASYAGLPEVGIGHQAHNTSEPGVVAIKVLPRIHKVFSLFKRVVLGTFQGSVSHKHLPKYLNEFEFRFNRRASASRWLLFQRVLEAGAAFRGPTLKSITQPVVVA
jgi:transposase-like protein